MLIMNDNMGTSMSPVNGSERVDGGVVPAIIVRGCTKDALLRDVCPEILVVHCQRCLPCTIEPVAHKPPISLQVATAVLTTHWVIVMQQSINESLISLQMTHAVHIGVLNCSRRVL